MLHGQWAAVTAPGAPQGPARADCSTTETRTSSTGRAGMAPTRRSTQSACSGIVVLQAPVPSKIEAVGAPLGPGRWVGPGIGLHGHGWPRRRGCRSERHHHWSVAQYTDRAVVWRPAEQGDSNDKYGHGSVRSSPFLCALGLTPLSIFTRHGTVGSHITCSHNGSSAQIQR